MGDDYVERTEENDASTSLAPDDSEFIEVNRWHSHIPEGDDHPEPIEIIHQHIGDVEVRGTKLTNGRLAVELEMWEDEEHLVGVTLTREVVEKAADELKETKGRYSDFVE